MTSDGEPLELDDRWRGLMRAAQCGDAEAYAELLQQAVPWIRRVVRRRRGRLRPEDVEDVVQDVLLAVHAVRATYDPERPFLPWLLAIVRHRLVDQARRDVRRAAHECPGVDLDVTFAARGANLVRGASADAAILRQAIAHLPAGQRRAIELLKIEGLSLKEAARATGASVGALKVATYRAMTALRKALANE